MKITKVVAHLIDREVTPYQWQVDRPGSGDGRRPDRAFVCLLRVCTDEGIEGHALAPKGRILLDLVERRIGPELIGKDPLNTEFLWERMWDVDRLEEFPLYALGTADIALWDIKGKAAGLPVCKMLGGYRDRIPAYASTTSYDSEQEYLDVAGAAVEAGYPSIKLHLRRRDVKTNARLCRAVRRFVGDDFELTLDASGIWGYTEALRFGRVLEELEFAWYEEPMREFDLESYARLCEALDIPVLAAECSDGAHWNAGEFIRRGACDILRTSTHYKGGFTGGLKVAHLAESFGMRAEVHGGGLPNLHLGLAVPNNTYYEDLVISVEDIKGKKDGPIPFGDGMVRLPENVTGIGLSIDLEDTERRALSTVEITEPATRSP
jgi:L-alanine-DL-glutamate epimerase-like enolase superfamily enzyme